MKKITIEDFGKDHWSLFAYVETRCVDNAGSLDKAHLRIKNEECKAGDSRMFTPRGWKQEWGTRLSGFFLDGDKRDKTRQLPDHDDLDCLEDLEDAGLIKNIGSGMFPAEKLTKHGREIASKLREHKAEGKNYCDFKIID
jgi:hypothetical protein